MSSYKVLGYRVLVRRDEPVGKTETGIILPTNNKKKSGTGTIVEVGEGKRLESGDLILCGVMIGQRVLFNSYAGTDIENTDLVLIAYDDVLAVIR